MIDCAFGNYGCLGGYLIPALDHLVSDGVVTHACKPYTTHLNKCTQTCSVTDVPFEKYFCKEGSVKLLTSRSQIQQEIMQHGSVVSSVMVFEDFMNYQDGIYEYTTGSLVTGHALVIVGWDHSPDDGSLFWIARN